MSDLLEDGPERAVDVVRRALVADGGVGLVPERVPDGPAEAGLADPRLADQQDALPLAGRGLPPAVEQQRQFLVAADQRQRRARLVRRESVLDRAFAPHRKGLYRRADALERARPEIRQVEQAPDQAP